MYTKWKRTANIILCSWLLSTKGQSTDSLLVRRGTPEYPAFTSINLILLAQWNVETCSFSLYQKSWESRASILAIFWRRWVLKSTFLQAENVLQRSPPEKWGVARAQWYPSSRNAFKAGDTRQKPSLQTVKSFSWWETPTTELSVRGKLHYWNCTTKYG